MDNTRDLPGYKYYVDAETGERPAVMVAFVDLIEDPAASVNGVVFPVADLAPLDDRERNYERREVEPGLWAYIGTPEARERFRRGPTVIARDYLEQVKEPPTRPVRDLRRVNL